MFTLSSQLIIYIIKSADCLHYHRLIWRVFQVATTGSSGPSSLMGVRFAYSAMEQALPQIVEEVRIFKKRNKIKLKQLWFLFWLWSFFMLLFDFLIKYRLSHRELKTKFIMRHPVILFKFLSVSFEMFSSFSLGFWLLELYNFFHLKKCNYKSLLKI